MVTEDSVLKGTKLITNTKKQKLKIQSRGWILKNTIFKEKNKVTKIILYIYIYIYITCVQRQSLIFFKVLWYKKRNYKICRERENKKKKIKKNKKTKKLTKIKKKIKKKIGNQKPKSKI